MNAQNVLNTVANAFQRILGVKINENFHMWPTYTLKTLFWFQTDNFYFLFGFFFKMI